MNRHTFIRMAAGAAASMRFSRAQSAALPTTYTYKTAGSCEIKADVYSADESVRKPVFLWIHGGALISGSRKGLTGGFHRELVKQGYVVVSIDYRLAPVTKLPAIIEDLRDAHRWVRKSVPSCSTSTRTGSASGVALPAAT